MTTTRSSLQLLSVDHHNQSSNYTSPPLATNTNRSSQPLLTILITIVYSQVCSNTIEVLTGEGEGEGGGGGAQKELEEDEEQ